MDNELHLPWDNSALQELLLKIIQTGETTKVDFKRQLNIGTPEHNAELLKDISAMANTYDYSYRNHGFIVFGVSENKLTYTTFDQNEDGLQARIDEIIKNNLEPFVSTQVRIFGDGAEKWGVIVVPPTRTAPHVFTKDLHKRSRGEIFVRRGTTTDKAQSSDYVRFFRLHLDEHTYELRQQVEDLKRDVNSLKKRPARTESGRVAKRIVEASAPEQPKIPEQRKANIEAEETVNLLSLIDASFAREEDPISKGLMSEAQKLQQFLQGNTIAWDLNSMSKEEGKKILDDIENNASNFWEALGNLAFRDEKGKYDQAIIRALTVLAHVSEAPSGVSYSDWGTNIRYLPLVTALYIVFIACASTGRYTLLRKVLGICLSGRSRYDQPQSISYVLFYVRRASPVFQTQHPGHPQQSWCDPVATYIEQILQRRLKIDDPLLDKREAFFKGEFLLCLSPLDVVVQETKKPAMGHPSGGIFLYYSEAMPILKRYLRMEGKQIGQVFERPLKDILADFDQNSHRLISGRCSGDGFISGASEAAFPDSKKDAPPA